MTRPTGDVAERTRRWLDAHDPLDDPYRMDTDVGAAELFAELEPEARWCDEAQRLVMPTGLDNYYEAPGALLESMMGDMLAERARWAVDRAARAAEEGDRREAAARYAAACRRACTSAFAAGAARRFRASRRVRADELNCEPTVIGTPDGVVDLDYGELLRDRDEDGARQWRVTKRTRGRLQSSLYPEAEYDERWDEFVLEIMCGDAERAAYLKRALGYSALGANPEECMFVAYGATTRNGKGTLMESVAWALGDYAAAVDHDYLTEGRRAGGGADEETASLDGVRLVTVSEPTRGRRLDEARVKALTGGDDVSCRHLFGSQFRYRPQFTIWLSCNRLPQVGDTTVLTSGRVRVVPFERHFSEAERDPTLKGRFRTARGMSTVLTWLVEGYMEYRERGLAEPGSVRAATEAYLGVGGSTLARFVDECCTIRGGERMDVPDFNAAYRAFCEELDEPPLTAQRVRAEFEGMGVPKRRSNGSNFYSGVSLNERGLAYAASGEGKSCTESAEKRTDGGRGGRIRLS